MSEPYPIPREIGTIENVTEALEAIKRLASDDDSFVRYRGHGSIGWRVLPSLFRQSDNLINSEYLIVREIVSRFPDHFLNDRTMFDRLVRMQHFALPTRLMDVTSNPLVGLFFAASELPDSDGALVALRIPSDRKKYYDSDSISCICNLANLKNSEKDVLRTTTASNISDFNKLYPTDRLFQFIREEKLHFQPRIKREDLFRPYYVIPKLSNPRIIAQSGAFVAFGLHWNDGKPDDRGIRLYCLRIPAAAKAEILVELDDLGIHEGALFPEIDRTAQQIRKAYS